MSTGALTSSIDVAQILLYAFWIFFAGLLIYLRREDKREGYPLDSDRSGRVVVQGFPAMPGPKTFRMADGTTRQVPRAEEAGEIAAKPVGPWPGAPLLPTGNPMLDGVGPASYSQRSDVPDMTFEGLAKIVPMRLAEGFEIDSRDPDPRGLAVRGADNRVAGTVEEVWVDRTEPQIRYLEVKLTESMGSRQVLLPIGFARISGRLMWRGRVTVESIYAHQFADVPATKSPDQVTRLEEDRITAYYASGHLYAHPWRQEPAL